MKEWHEWFIYDPSARRARKILGNQQQQNRGGSEHKVSKTHVSVVVLGGTLEPVSTIEVGVFNPDIVARGPAVVV